MSMQRHWSMVAAIAGCLACCVGPAIAEWDVVEMPFLGTWAGGSELTDINENGVACGMGNYVINTTSTAIRFDGTTVTELPFYEPNQPVALTTGINNHGVICGYSRKANGNSQAVLWDGATITALPYPPDANPAADLRAYDINDDGVVCGYFWSNAGERTAFYYKDGVSYSLDAPLRAAGLLGLQIANEVNENGIICGEAKDPSDESSGYLYDIDTGVVTVTGRYGFESSSARALNDANQTIGRGRDLPWDPFIPALTYDGGWHAIDPDVTVTQWGEDINNGGRMLGFAESGIDRWTWYADGYGPGSMVEVSVPGWTELTLVTINEKYWMVGYGVTATSGGEDRAIIVKPPLGDGDYDGTVEIDDLLLITGCLTGPDAGGASDDCLNAFDFDVADGDIDLADVLGFQLAFEGS